jgi:hypothetical protein
VTERDPFDVLGVPRAADVSEARAAFHRLVEIYHPDRFQGRDPDLVAEATRRLEEVIAAWAAIRGRATPAPVPASDEPGSITLDDQGPRRDGDGSAGAVFDAEIQAVSGDGPPLHVRWAGDGGEAVLRALIRLHRTGRTAVEQIDWGAFALTLDGADVRRLVEQTALAGGRDARVSVVAGPEDLEPESRLSRVLPHLDAMRRYRVYAENF